MKKFPLDRKTIIIGMLIAAVAVLAARGMSQWQKAKIASLKAKISAGGRRYNLASELLQVYAQADGLKKKLIEPGEEALLLDTIKEAAKTNFVKLDKIEADTQGAREGRYLIKPIQAIFTGSYRDTVKFIEKVESLNYFVLIASLNCKVQEPLTQVMLYQPSGEAEDRIISTDLKLLAVYVNR